MSTVGLVLQANELENTGLDSRVEFVIRASLHEDYADTDFVHSIRGRIFAKVEDEGEEKETGYIKASLVQFGEAMDHGISTERLSDGIDGNIAEYWEHLFDLDSGYWKEEIRDEYEALGCDLLIIDCVEVQPFRPVSLIAFEFLAGAARNSR